jgi:hypothetical protein
MMRPVVIHIQQQLTPTKENTPFGDLITTKQEGSTRIFFQNVNSIYKYQSWRTFEDATKQLKDKSVDIFGLGETNLHWDSRKKTQLKTFYKNNLKFVPSLLPLIKKSAGPITSQGEQ